LQPKQKKFISDIDPSAISKNVPVEFLSSATSNMFFAICWQYVKPLDTLDWIKTIDQWKLEHPLRYRHDDKLARSMSYTSWGEMTRETPSS